MKKLLLALIWGLVFFPVTATAQKWVEPYMERDGTNVEGHYESPKDSWQRGYSQPGTVNPMTGQFNTYGSRNHLAPPNSISSPQTPAAIPGSSDPNQYAVPGSSPKPNAPNPQGSFGSGR
jgi:hypothetical protein